MNVKDESVMVGGSRAAWIFWTIGAAVFVAMFAIKMLSSVVLLTFTATMVAVLLNALAQPLRRWLHLPNVAAVPIVCVVVIGAAVGLGFILGPRIVAQVNELQNSLPQALGAVQGWINKQTWIQGLIPSDGLGSVDVTGRLNTVFSSVAGMLSGLFVVTFASIYLAMQPHLYVTIIVHLLPQGRRERLLEVLRTMASGLRRWLLGRLAAMAVVGILTGLGLWVLDSRLALTLGLFAGVFHRGHDRRRVPGHQAQTRCP